MLQKMNDKKLYNESLFASFAFKFILKLVGAEKCHKIINALTYYRKLKSDYEEIAVDLDEVKKLIEDGFWMDDYDSDDD